MRYLRLLILSFLFLFITVTLISLLIPGRVRISRAVDVRATPASIWKEVDNLGNWRYWNPFFKGVQESAIKPIDTVGGVLNAMEVNGTMVSWKERNADERVAYMERPGRKPVVNAWRCIVTPGGDSTTLQWYMDFNLRWYPWEKFGSIMFERSYGPQMEQGLAELKKRAESGFSSQ